MTSTSTPEISDQLKLWEGEFGYEYTKRNFEVMQSCHCRMHLWCTVLRNIPLAAIKSILEVGANIGLNLRALSAIASSELYAVEPNDMAFNILLRDKVVNQSNAYLGSTCSLKNFASNSIDIVFTCGVLIHVHPKDLKVATDEIVRVAKKYVICIEYFSDKEEETVYRGIRNFLFKRDFGSHYLENYSDLSLVDYGFLWKRVTGLDNLT